MRYSNIDRIKILGRDDAIHCERERIYSVKAHWHDFYEIELVMEGEGTHLINGREYDFCRGTMYLMRLTDYHEIRLKSESAVSHKIQIPPSLMPKGVLHVIMLSNADLTVSLSEEQLDRLHTLYTLIEQQSADTRYGNLLANQLLSAMILLFMQQSDSDAVTAYSRVGERMRSIVYYVQEHFAENITVGSIAEHFYLNKNYLCTFFKANTGVTLLQYIRNLRLKNAARLAVNTELKSIEICESCGYTSISNFLRDFKAEYGVSPMELRHNHNK